MAWRGVAWRGVAWRGSRGPNYLPRKTIFWSSLALVLVLLALVTHWPVRKGFFQVDDFLWLHLANLRSVAESFIGKQGVNVAYRPIFRLSTYIDSLVFGRHAAAWHFENVVLNAANALALGALLRAYRLPYSVIATAAILFVLAPLSGESVNWISGRGSLLCFLLMQLSVWRWTVALESGKPVWAAIGWMLLAAMTYEAAVALPFIMICLIPIVNARLAVSLRSAIRSVIWISGAFAIFCLIRAGFLGTFGGNVDSVSTDLLGNFRSHMHVLGILAPMLGGERSIWLIAAALGICMSQRRLRVAGICLLIVALLLILPYSPIVGTGGRFFYMLQAPLCVIAVLPSLAMPSLARIPALIILLALLTPKFADSDWHEASSFTNAGISTRVLVDAIHEAIPVNQGYANVIDGIPEADHSQLMMGDFFEMGLSDSYNVVPPPWIVRTRTVFSNVQMVKDILRIPTHFWRYDAEAKRLLPIERQAFIDTHPEIKEVR